MTTKNCAFSIAKIQSRKLLKENALRDFVYIDNNSNILLSTPHSVSQIRLGKNKVAETGTLPFALVLSKMNNLNLIFKTKNNFDDANFDSVSKYKNRIIKDIKNNKINHILDIHGLAKWRECDINLGINFGKNIDTNIELFDELVTKLRETNLRVTIDNPFCAGPRTLSGDLKNKFDNIWTLQIEINCKITNEPHNIKKCNLLLQTFDWFIKNKLTKN